MLTAKSQWLTAFSFFTDDLIVELNINVRVLVPASL
jgi:hypothetical protein